MLGGFFILFPFYFILLFFSLLPGCSLVGVVEGKGEDG